MDANHERLMNMPGHITHLLCGDKVSAALAGTEAGKRVSVNKRAFYMGTQGPDFLFYHAVFSRAGGINAGKLGMTLHGEKTGEFITAMLRYATGQPEGSRDRDALSAYIFGYICHYSLDLHAHPYIHYRSGFDARYGTSRSDRKHKYRFHHRIFETCIDVLMLQRLKNKKPADIDAASILDLSRYDARMIARMYEWALFDVYSIHFESFRVADAFKHMIAIIKLLKDRTGIKRRVSSFIENLLHTYPAISSMIHPSAESCNNRIDYLNLNKKAWSLPWDEKALSSETFIDIFEKSAAEALRMCRFAWEWLNGGHTDVTAVLREIGNRSLSTGLDCSDKREFIYCDCVFE